MSSPSRTGQRGRVDNLGRAASARNAGRSPHRRTAAEQIRRYPVDPHDAPDTPAEQAARDLFLADQTPGLDEAHATPGHPSYRPKGP